MYGGIQFRSRIEARWAAFFDVLKWKWTYEPFDLAGWIPDFLVHGDSPLLVEVKSDGSTDELGRHTAKIDASGRGGYEVLVVGCTPVLRDECDNFGAPCGGLIWEGVEGGGDWGNAGWFRCATCGSLNVLHDLFTWRGRPCGHYDGDHLIQSVESAAILDLWARACNATQWTPHPAVTHENDAAICERVRRETALLDDAVMFVAMARGALEPPVTAEDFHDTSLWTKVRGDPVIVALRQSSARWGPALDYALNHRDLVGVASAVRAWRLRRDMHDRARAVLAQRLGVQQEGGPE